MDARQTWQALQARLTAARAAADAGDRDRALAEIAAALAIDPHFLAAHSLRDRILGDGPSAVVQQPKPIANQQPTVAAASSATADRPLGSGAGYSELEQRARRRRLDRRLEAARAALDERQLAAAAKALDEVTELDPDLPGLTVLTSQFNDLRAAAAAHRGPRLAAAAVFAIMILGASWLHDSTSLVSWPTIGWSSLMPSPTGALEPLSDGGAVGTTGDTAASTTLAGAVEPARTSSVKVVASIVTPQIVQPDAPFTAPRSEPIAPPLQRTAPIQEAALSALGPVAAPTPAPVVPALAPAVAPAAAAPAATAALAPAVVTPDESVLVKQTLQRYRSAYEGLDAHSAQAVWPAVNQAALARAFDGLESQTLTFEACDVRVLGESATATCRGSARYVPKIGSREPRIEPRVWNFTLHKNAGDWTIDNARAER